MGSKIHDAIITGEVVLNDVELTASAAELNIMDGVTASTAELNIIDGVTADTAEINRVADVSGRLVAAGSALVLTQAAHEGRKVLLDQSGGTDITLPASSGSGAVFEFIVSVAPSGDTHTISVVGNDEFIGGIDVVLVTDAADAWQAAAADNFDRVTMNGGTQGGLVGDRVTVIDIATGVWMIEGRVTGATSTPFSDASIT